MLHRDGKKVICPRVKSNVKLKCGYLHKVWDNNLTTKNRKLGKHRSNTCINWTGIARQYYRKSYKRQQMDDLGIRLDIPGDVLRSTWRVGWDGEAFTIPCYNGFGEMNGIMRRFPDKHKVWVARSRNGLFIPKLKSWRGNLFICEGWTDAAAMVSTGFRAIGRANCQTGLDYIKDLLARHKDIRQVIVVGDNNPDNVHGNVGKDGALVLAKQLRRPNFSTGTLQPPSTVVDFWAWFDSGCTKETVISRIKML